MAKTDSKLSAGFSGRLREMRKHLKLSQTEIAQACGGWRTDTWSRIERGDNKTVSLEMICGIADHAAQNGISLSWLFAGRGHITQGGKSSRGYQWLIKASREDLLAELTRLISDQHLVNRLVEIYYNSSEKKAFCDAMFTKK